MTSSLRSRFKAALTTVPRGALIVAGYVAAHYGLSLLSTNLEITHNISVWYLPGGLLFGGLMVARGSQVGWVLAGDVAARTIWAVGVYAHPALMVVALVISPLIYGSVTALLKSSRLAAGFESSTAVMWLVIGMVTAPAIAAPLNCLNYALDGVFRWADLGTIIPSFLIGDLVGIGTLMPLILAVGLGTTRKRLEVMVVVRTMVVPAVAALVLFAAFHSGRPELYTSAKFLMFVPLSVVALREGWRGAAVAIVILNFSIVLALAVHQVPIAVIDIQLLLLSYSLFALTLGVVVAERRAAERISDLLAAAAHSSPNALGIVDLHHPDQRFLFVNNALITLSGRSADALGYTSWRDLHGDGLDRSRLDHGATRLDQRQPLEMDLRMTRGDAPCIVRVKGGPVIGADGQCQAYLMTYFDITEEKHREQVEREREKLIALGQLASGVAHELNNLVHPIINFAKLAEKRFDSDPARVRRYLDGIRTCGVRAGEIVQKVLLFARPQPVNRRVLPLGTLVNEAVDLIRTRVPPTVSLVLDTASEGLVRVDPTEVAQIVTNLVLNATHAVPKDGTIAVTIDRATIEAGSRTDAVPAPGRYLRLMVADNGHGMDEDTRRRIFDPFFSTKPIGEGTGLGLSVVYGLVVAAGGAITVDSKPGHGTTFRVYLPEATGGNKD